MDAELERVLRGFEEASAFAKAYRFDLTGDYVALIERVEAFRQNRAGADKSGRWRCSRADARARVSCARPLPRTP